MRLSGRFRRLTLAICATGLLSSLVACAVRSSSHPHLLAPDAAEIFSGEVISDDNEQWRITFTLDGKTAYFAESAEFFPFTRKATIYVSQYLDGKWRTPVVAPFSGTYSDIDPFISPDGQRLYFSSIRPVDGVQRSDIDLWMVERTRAGWSAPIHLGPEVNSPADELYPSASADGTIYFASGPSRPQRGGNFDIYSAAKNGDGFAPRKPLGPGVNTAPSTPDPTLQAAWEFNPEISADGRTLVFTSLRQGGFGLGEL
jgi:Tol biopolymer transport system component